MLFSDTYSGHSLPIGIHGPYFIHYMSSNGKLHFWSIAGHGDNIRVIKVTESKQYASSFFIERDHEGAGAHFLIATSEDGKATEYPLNPFYIHMCSTRSASTTKGGNLKFTH